MNFHSFNVQVILAMVVAGAISYASFYFIGSWSILVGVIGAILYSLIYSNIRNRKRNANR